MTGTFSHAQVKGLLACARVFCWLDCMITQIGPIGPIGRIGDGPQSIARDLNIHHHSTVLFIHLLLLVGAFGMPGGAKPGATEPLRQSMILLDVLWLIGLGAVTEGQDISTDPVTLGSTSNHLIKLHFEFLKYQTNQN